MHDINLITTIAFGLLAALVCGLLAKRVGLSPIIGYLVAGIIVGPFTPGFVGDAGLAKQLAEIGVILLMFGVGLHFHLDDLLAVRSIAVPGALGQSIAATLVAMVVAIAVGWSWQSGIVLGIAVSVASTVVLLRVLMDHNMVETTEGRVAVGWLVVEDIITVVVLVMLPALAVKEGIDTAEVGGGLLALAKSVGLAVGKMAILGVIVVVAGAKFVPWLLLRVARLRSRELFTLTVLVMAMAIATLGYTVFGASMALGAFLAGMVVGQSKVSHQAAADALPMRDAFAVLFFVSVGMLFDWRTVLHEPGLVLGLIFVILVVKPVVALVIVLVGGHSLRTGLTVAGGLAQVGEFSFIVADVAKVFKIMPDAGQHALVAGAIISISLNPWMFRSLLALEPWVQKHPRLSQWLNRSVAARGQKANHAEVSHPPFSAAPRVIIIGFGPVGRTVMRRVEELKLEPFVIDMNVDTVLALQTEKKHALYGDATHADILDQAGVKKAAYLVVSMPDSNLGLAVLTKARELNPRIKVLLRSRYVGEGNMLQEAGADAVCYDEAESATALAVVLGAHIKAGTHREDPATAG